MLSRVLEPEVMDTPEEALAYDSMDHSEVNRVFVEDFLAAGAMEPVASIPACEILDLGTGTALIPIELCRRVAAARVLAIDLSSAMLNLAKGNIEVAGVTEQIRLDRVDGKALPYSNGRFSAVMSNSIVHHIPEPSAVLHEAWRVLAPGGLIFVRDLLRPHEMHELERLVATYAATADAHQRQLFADSLHAALSLDEVRHLVAGLGADPNGVRQTSDRHWTWSARKSPAC
jgi:ubiquinone/menaquinone biosynthesis C-methylase UbiE